MHFERGIVERRYAQVATITTDDQRLVFDPMTLILTEISGRSGRRQQAGAQQKLADQTAKNGGERLVSH